MHHMHHCRPNVTAPIVHPTKCCVKNLYSVTEVPHIHPSHTTYVNNQMYQHKHYHPHTDSVVNNVQQQHFNAGPGYPPGMGPGMVAGAQTGPGMPGFGPGMGPGMVAGAQTGMPGMGPGMVAGAHTNMPGMVAGAQTPGWGKGCNR